MGFRKQQALNLLNARPVPNLRAAWDGLLPDNNIVIIGWSRESEFDVSGELIECIVFRRGHPANHSPGGRKRELHINRLMEGESSAFLLLADANHEAGEGVKDSIRNELYRVRLEGRGDLVCAVAINRSSLSDWLNERKEMDADFAEQQIWASDDILDTERQSLVKARRGQGLFRDRVLAIEQCCRVTGVKGDAFLRASHIKPWAVSDNVQRLDGNNGLALSPHVDVLFDGGYISFSDDGSVLLSDECRGVWEQWNLNQYKARPFNEQQRQYLAYHRNVIFRSNR